MSIIKKFTAMLFAAAIAFSFTACQGSAGGETGGNSPTSNTSADTSLPAQNIANDTSIAARDDASDTAQDLPSNANDTAEKGKVLVAYFSCTGNTKKLAEYAADITGGTLYEIVPAEPYTSADLNYNDSGSRTSIEQNDKNCRPEISGKVDNFDSYDIIFLAYPIWWGEAPRIIYTFAESYDFSGKTVVPFCTSGSSGIGSSAKNLHSLTPGADWLDGVRHSSSMTKEEMSSWISGLGLGY